MRKKHGSVTLRILDEISRISEGLVLAFLDRKELHRRLWQEGISYSRFTEKIKKMEAENLISIKETVKGLSVELTGKGRIKHIENNVSRIIDGKWRMLSFDIPETHRNLRNQFRRSIKKIGFKQVQKSLWACPYIKADEIEVVIKELGLNKYVAYLVVEKTDIDKYLNELFHLTQ